MTTIAVATTDAEDRDTVASSDNSPATSSSLSEYESLRARNIQRNNARLRELGLISRREEKESNAAALRQKQQKQTDSPSGNDSSDEDGDYEEGDAEDFSIASWNRRKNPRGRKRKGNHKAILRVRSSPSRKSRRLQGLQADGTAAIDDGDDEVRTLAASLSSAARLNLDRRALVEECRVARQRAALQHASLGAAAAARENPTATYDHCLMRCRTMTQKALAGRVKAIERATGKHCVVKMAIFKSCLQDEGHWDLAELASRALERLKALQPPPPPKEAN